MRRSLPVLLVGFFLAASLAATSSRFALLVAVDRYPVDSGFEPVPGSEADVEELTRVLGDLGFEVVARTGSAATREAIDADLRRLRRSCGESTELLWLFFSGRAYGKSRGDYLATVDARSSDLEIRGVDLDRWRDVCPGTPTLLLLDVPAEVRGPGLLTLKPPRAVRSDFVEMRSASSGKGSHFDPDLGGRIFARSLLAGLGGAGVDARGRLEVEGLLEHVERSVRLWSFEHGQLQKPQHVGSMAVVLASGHAPAPAADPTSPWQGQKISLSVKDADLQEVLRSIARLAGVNLVLDPGVRGTVTLELKDVPWDQALEVILKSQGLGAVWEDSWVRVEP